ncbi:hypothetical protein [Brotaphodocola sp.]|uniref:hypothetical protein n=1 Tax=Brotaphodocola sp. TaxID=3073577 RepID=UPI003D7D1AF9
MKMVDQIGLMYKLENLYVSPVFYGTMKDITRKALKALKTLKALWNGRNWVSDYKNRSEP